MMRQDSQRRFTDGRTFMIEIRKELDRPRRNCRFGGNIEGSTTYRNTLITLLDRGRTFNTSYSENKAVLLDSRTFFRFLLWLEEEEILLSDWNFINGSSSGAPLPPRHNFWFTVSDMHGVFKVG